MLFLLEHRLNFILVALQIFVKPHLKPAFEQAQISTATICGAARISRFRIPGAFSAKFVLVQQSA